MDESKCGISATEEAKLARLYEKYGIATADEGGVNLVNSMGRQNHPSRAGGAYYLATLFRGHVGSGAGTNFTKLTEFTQTPGRVQPRPMDLGDSGDFAEGKETPPASRDTPII